MQARFISYSNLDAPDVEVRYRATWCQGTLHEWRQDPATGRWSGWVRFSTSHSEHWCATFDQDDVRPLRIAEGPIEANGRPPALHLPAPD